MWYFSSGGNRALKTLSASFSPSLRCLKLQLIYINFEFYSVSAVFSAFG